MSIETKQHSALSDIYLEAVYGKSPEQIEAQRRKDDDLAGAPKQKKKMVVTRADLKGGTEAAKRLKQGDPRYAAADHLKDDKNWGYDKKGNSLNPVDKMKKERKDDELFGAPNKKVKKESYSDWREDLKEVPDYEKIPISAKKRNEKITEKDVNNEIKINPEFKEEVEIISEKEVKVKDTRRVDDAIDAYEKSKDASRAATADSEEGHPEKAATERKYAAKERGEIDKDDPKWKKRKYHTGIHGESYEATKKKEVLDAMKRQGRKLSDKDKEKIAAKVVKDKGDTSKSDDRYAYESLEVEENIRWDRVAQDLTRLGEMTGVQYRVEGYQQEGKKKKKYGLDDIERAPGKPNTLVGTKGFLKYAEKMTPGQ